MKKKKITEAKDIHVSGDFIAGDQYNYYYTGDFASLAEYYISPESVFQRVRTDDFIGRDWLTAKVDAFLNDPNRKSGAFLLIGDAGVGKTSFMAHLVKERRYLHLFAEQAPGQAMLQRAMQSLGSQLVTRYQIDPYKDRDTLNALSVFPDFLERILRLAASALTKGEKIVIVCDALDEAGVFPDHFVFGLPKELPDGVYFILSQRPVNVKLPNFEPVIEKLEAQGKGNLQDMEAYLSAVAKRPEVAGQIRSKEYSEEFFIQTLKEKSQGVWMYLHYIIKEIESGARAPLDLANLPTGLVGYYAEYWDAWRTGKRGKGEEAWDELYAPLLTTLAAAQEAIPVDWLIQWADVTVKPREVTRLLTEHWRAFIIEKEKDGQKTYTPYHLSLKDFITGRVDTDKLPPAQANLVNDLAAQTMDAHKRIVSAFEKECNGEWEKLVEQDYPRLHLATHMNGAGEYEKLRILLTEGDEKIKWAEAREKKEETYAGYLNDLNYVWDFAEREQNYALLARCMLIENSIYSLVMNIPLELLPKLVKLNLWSYVRYFSILKLNSPDFILESLQTLASDMPPSIAAEALRIIEQFSPNDSKNELLTLLVPRLDASNKQKAINIIVHDFENPTRQETDKYEVVSKADLIIELLPNLDTTSKIKVIQVILSEFKKLNLNGNYSENIYTALLKLIPFLSTEEQTLVVDIVCPHENDEINYSFLTRIASLLKSVELQRKIVELLLRNKKTVDYLIEIIPLLHQSVKQYAFEKTLDTYSNIELIKLVKILDHCPENLRQGILKSTFFIFEELVSGNSNQTDEYVVYFIAEIVPYLEEGFQLAAYDKFINLVKRFSSPQIRIKAFLALANVSSPNINNQIIKMASDEFLLNKAEFISHEEYFLKIAASAIKNEENKNLLSEIAEELLSDAYRTWKYDEFSGDYSVKELILSIAPYFDKHSLRRILHITNKMLLNMSPYAHEILICIAPYLKYFSDKNLALEITNNISISLDAEVLSLIRLAPQLDSELRSYALENAFYLALNRDSLSDDVLRELVQYLNTSDKIQLGAKSVKYLNVISNYLEINVQKEMYASALENSRKIGFSHCSIVELMNYLPAKHRNLVEKKALHEVEETEESDKQRYYIEKIFPFFSKKYRLEAFKILMAMKETSEKRAETINAIRYYLDAKSQEMAIQQILSDLQKVDNLFADSSFEEFQDAILQMKLLLTLRFFWTGEPNGEVAYFISKTLSKVFQVNTVKESVDRFWSCINNNIASELIRDELSVFRSPGASEEINLLLQNNNDNELLDGVFLMKIKSIENKSQSARFLAVFNSRFDDGSKKDAVQFAYELLLDIKSNPEFSSLYEILSTLLTKEMADRIITNTLTEENQNTRINRLFTLMPHLSKSQALTTLKITIQQDENFNLNEILSRWEKYQFEDLDKQLVTYLKSKRKVSRDGGFSIVSALTPALVHFRGPEIADELYRTITDVTRWWP